MNTKDDDGALANWIVGGLVGGIIGGISAAIQGKSVWAGAAQGATTGAIAGASIDVALAVVATGGVAGVALAAGVAFVGGYCGNVAGEEANSIVSTGKLKSIDKEMHKRSIRAGVINVVSLGFNTLLKHASDGAKGFNTSGRVADVVKSAGKQLTDFSSSSYDVINAFGATHFSLYGELVGMVS